MRRPWLGVTLQPVPNHQLGLLVVSVASGGPAAQAGIRPGDLITSVNGRPVNGLQDVVHVLEQSRIGQRIQVGLLRGNSFLSLSIQLQEAPMNSPAA